jgi:hypothetical protein
MAKATLTIVRHKEGAPSPGVLQSVDADTLAQLDPDLYEIVEPGKPGEGHTIKSLRTQKGRKR